MENLYFKQIKLLNNLLQGNEEIITVNKSSTIKDANRFSFTPKKSIMDQLIIFCEYINRKNQSQQQWKLELSIKGFQGLFKIEHWIYIEQELRTITNLKLLQFIDTQLDKIHLTVLGKLLNWLELDDLELILKQNEIDDQDIEDFIFGLFQANVRFNRIIIKSNPGIYKGRFIIQLEMFLQQQEFNNNKDYYYQVIKNIDTFSLGIFKIKKGISNDQLEKKNLEVKNLIEQTIYYDLNLDSCFNNQNCGALYKFLDACYDEDNLEQLVGLDISNNLLGDLSYFTKACQQFATSKGLLKLSIGNQTLIHNSVSMESLCGNRYDSLRLNYFSFKNNTDMTSKTYEFLSKNILPSLKKIDFTDCLPAQLDTLQKIFFIIESMESQVETLRKTKNAIKNNLKLQLEELDLCTVENYNRHDLMYKLIKYTIFNEFSSVQKLIMPNCDAGRMEAYVKAYKDFKDYLQQHQSQLKNFKLPLNEIILPEQRYSMEKQINIDFLLTLVFTMTDNFLETKSITFKQTNNVSQRNEAFSEALKIVSENKNNQPYSLKSFTAIDMKYTFQMEDIQTLLCANNLNLEKFNIEDTSCELNGTQFQEILDSKIKDLEISNKFWSLKSLKLKNCYYLNIELYGFLSTMLFNKRVNLEELYLSNITFTMDENKQDLLMNEKNNYNQICSLKSIELEQLENIVVNCLFSQVIFNKSFKFINISLIKIEIYEAFQDIISKYENYKSEDHIFSSLEKLHFSEIILESSIQWTQIAQIFIFNQYSNLKQLSLSNMNIDQTFVNGVEQSISDLLLIEKICEQKLHKIEFIGCTFHCDFLKLFCLNIFCKIKELILQDCIDVDQYILKSQQQFESQAELITIQLNSFQVINCQINQSFDFLLDKIIFHEKQKLTKLVLKNCSLTNENLSSLAKKINYLKELEQDKGYKRFFKLRQIDLSGNIEVDLETWEQFFSILLNSKKKMTYVQSNIINQDENNQTVDKHENSLILEQNINQFEQNKLNIEEKIFNHPNVFTFIPPQNLKILNLNMKFNYLGHSDKCEIYSQIIKGLIVHYKSQLQKLILSDLDLDIFMNNFEIVQEQAMKYYYNMSQESNFSYQIKDIQIQNLTNESEDSTQKFVQLIICSKHIDLQKLNLSGFSFNLIKQILDQSNLRDNYQLQELKIGDIIEALDQSYTQLFIKNIIFGQVFPIEILEIGVQLEFQGDFNEEIDIKNVKLKKLTLCQLTSSDAELIIQNIIKILLNDYPQNLEYLSILGTYRHLNIFNLFFKDKQQELKDLQIKELNIEPIVTIDKDFLHLLQLCKNSLQKLKIDSISMDNETQNALQIYDNIETLLNNSCNLIINEIQGENKNVITENFIFNNKNNFENFIFSNLSCFNENLSFGTGYEKLKELKLQFNLFYNDYQQLDTQALETIGKYFIYNKKSVLEQLTLHQCHLKPPGLLALTSQANSFREEIENSNQKQNTYLSLKRFNIYYSLYIEQEGAECINRDILFFEYISIERLELQVTNWNSDQQIHMCKCAQNWLKFQKLNKRKHIHYFPLKYFDIGRNEFVQTEEAWKLTFQTFLFTDLTPQLEILNIHFMALTDATVELITQAAKEYFNTKSKRFIYSVKKLNFSYNTSLTHIGWLNISKNFFFHQNVELEEINLSNTSLDNSQKINNIIQSAIFKAKSKKNNKLSLHTLLTYNTQLKQQLNQYLSPQPENYQAPYDLPVNIDYEMNDVGDFSGVPEEYGQFLQCQTNILYNFPTFSTKEWNDKTIVKFSTYHLSLAQHYIKILNDYYIEQGQNSISLYFSLQTLGQFANMFKYTALEPGCPYPFALLFQLDTFKFFEQQNSNIKKIYIINTEVSQLESITFEFIIFIWENIKKSQCSIDQIIMKYYLDDDLIDYMFGKNYTEADIIQLIRLIPPSRIRIQNSLSLQSIKAIYSIFYDIDTFEYSQLSYDFDNFLNNGIGYALREAAYDMHAIGLRSYIKYFLYHFFSIFVEKSGEHNKYVFDQEVIQLNNFLSTQGFFFFIICINNILFLGICILSPYFFSHYYDGDSTSEQTAYYCQWGPSKNANYLYYGYAFLSLLIEMYIFKKVAQTVPHHMKKIKLKIIKDDDDKSDDEESQKKNVIVPQSEGELLNEKPTKKKLSKSTTIVKSTLKSLETQVNKFSNSQYGWWLNFLLQVISSQVAKYDLFNDICFILTCYYCEEMVLFWITLVITIIQEGMNILNFIYLIFIRLTESNQTIKLLSTKFINDFYKISNVGKNIALSSLLDQVAPFNVNIIPNNFITRYLIPRQAGKAINDSVKSYLFQFLFEDFPQIIVLIIFIIRRALKLSGSIQWNIIVTIITSSITAITSFIKFMSIRPTYLQQNDFDKLSDSKLQNVNTMTQQYLKLENEQLEKYSKLYLKVETQNNINLLNESEQLL